MNIEIKIPVFGDKKEQAKVFDIYVEPGIKVNKDDILFSVETDDVVLEVSAPDAGMITDITIASGDSVDLGQCVMHLSIDANDVSQTMETGNPTDSSPAENLPETTQASDDVKESHHADSAPELSVTELSRDNDSAPMQGEIESQNDVNQPRHETIDSEQKMSQEQSLTPLQWALLIAIICGAGFVISII